MLAEMKKEKFFSKKVCSETSFQRDLENKRKPEKQNILSSFRLLNKKCSKSLNDLTREINYNLCASERIHSFVPPEKDKFRNDIVLAVDCNNKNKEARRCILNLLMLNAWRRQKTVYITAQEKIKNLNNKVEGFEMQVYVLRQLLNAEKQRVEVANDNIHDLLKKIEETTKEKNLIATENENVEKNFAKLSEYCSEMENALKNQENDIITSRLEAKNWEKQLKKEREKLKKMEREEIFLKEKKRSNNAESLEKIQKWKTESQEEYMVEMQAFYKKSIIIERSLVKQSNAKAIIMDRALKHLQTIKEQLKKFNHDIEKIQLTEKVLILKTQQIEQLTQDNKELQQKLDVQVPLWDETMAQVDLANEKLKESELFKKELEKALEEKEKEMEELKAKIVYLEKRLQEEDEKNGLLGKSILEKSNELSMIQKKLLELSKSSYPWSGGMIKIASFCAKIPVACICTVGSLLLPFPSYRL